ncbi:MAG: hypothetical protein ACK5HT_02965 [Draconibacterium sp.]
MFNGCFSGYVLNKIMKIESRTFFIAEMPGYKLPLLKNVALTVWEKTKSFVVGAGKIILAISIVLWFLAANGPGEEFRNTEEMVRANYQNEMVNDDELSIAEASYKLRHSYIGIIGHTIAEVSQNFFTRPLSPTLKSVTSCHQQAEILIIRIIDIPAQ